MVSNFHGETLPNTPRVQASGDLEYAWGLSNGYAPFVGGNLYYESAAYNGFGENASVKIDDYALLDLRGGVDSPDGRWRAAVWAHNVANQYYWINQLRIGDTITKVTGMPRTVGVNFSYRFQ